MRPERVLPVRPLARDYPRGAEVAPHSHQRGQFIHATEGVMEIRAQDCLWLLPPGRAVWVPPRVEHAMRSRSAVALRTLYISPDAIPRGLPQRPAGFTVRPLLRELILRAVENDAAQRAGEGERRLLALILDELASLDTEEIKLPLASDPRLVRACERILADIGDEPDIAALAAHAGASPRTLVRLARSELGCTLSVWRQQARVLEALPGLLAGASVIETAHALGYETASAFAAMFRRHLGLTPRAFARQGQGALRSGGRGRPSRGRAGGA